MQNTKLVPLCFLLIVFTFCSCSKGEDAPPLITPPASFNFNSLRVNGSFSGYTYYGINPMPQIKFSFSAPVNSASISNGLSFKDNSGSAVPYNTVFENNDSTIVITPANALKPVTKYIVSVSTDFKSKENAALQTAVAVNVITAIDSADKFPVITDEQLLDKVQQQTFKYFWDFGHPISGLARERNTSGDVVTSGGSGFGIMAIVTAVNRGFITRAEGLARMQKITAFLKNTARTFHGAFPHWLNGATGVAVPFSPKDNGADLVETSYLMQGLLTARQYFSGESTEEFTLRNDINTLYNNVEWSWFRKNGENTLYWHWSPEYNWDMNMPIRGWNECLITYVLAASSPTHSIPKIVYDNGWAGNGSIKTNNNHYNLTLPVGPAFGGPLFFSHYSFMGINPVGLVDQYANYQQQVTNHSKINYEYCKANPLNHYGYSNLCWGLTASDIPNGYSASSPTNDLGVIAPTAALSSFPYTPNESMNSLRFFYYKLGDKIFKEYGFIDAFSLKDPWFANSFLAIDQGPIIVMIENYRSGLLWNLFTSCPEVKTGMRNLGFTAPYLQ